MHELELQRDDDWCSDKIASKTSEFVSRILAPELEQSKVLISIDGLDGVGKTLIAKSLSDHIQSGIISIDDYIQTNNTGNYYKEIDFQRLSNDIKLALQAYCRVVVEGCLIRKILAETIDVPTTSVYVARTSRMRSNLQIEWYDESDLLFGDRTQTEFIKNEEDKILQYNTIVENSGLNSEHSSSNAEGSDSGLTLPMLRRENIEYHYEYSPHKKADILIKSFRLI